MICFGLDYEEEKFRKVVDATGFLQDIELFHNGIESLIGERGINLSGGQKARLSFARALYSDSDIYLLDDPFSAVDAEVGAEIFQKAV